MSNKKLLRKYFGEIMRESFALGTPKYYKVNISNPKTLLEELYNYICLTEEGNFLDENHVNYIIEEYLYRSNKDLIFRNNIKFFNNFNVFLTNNIGKKKKREDFLYFIDELKKRINPIIRTLNNNYFKQIKKQLFDILNKDSVKPSDFTTIKKICYSFSTEILRKGYSRTFIYEYILELLIKDNDVEKFINLFNGKINEYEIYLKVISKNIDIKDIFIKNYGILNIFIDDFPFFVNNDFYSGKLFGKFFKKNKDFPNSFWLKIEKKGLDYGVVSNNVVDNVNLFLDEIKFEYINDNVNIFHHALVKDKNGKINFSCISDYLYIHRLKSSIDFFNFKNDKIKKIYDSEIIEIGTKEKLKTIFRFYRYFLEANTIEHKFLNLWIGWEHIFSLNFRKESYTWKNISLFYPYIDSITYIEDILRDMIQVQLNRSKNKNNLDSLLGNNAKYFATNLYKIIKEKGENWDKLLELDFLKENDTVKVKLFRLHEKFKSPKKFVENNKNKVLWNLYRLYRVRNTIVHRGNIESLNLPIEILVTDLEIYYTNLLDFIIDRLSANDRFENIEQLFVSVQETYNSFVKEEGVSGIVDKDEIKKRIINLSLVF